jgi:hypothetical protein
MASHTTDSNTRPTRPPEPPVVSAQDDAIVLSQRGGQHLPGHDALREPHHHSERSDTTTSTCRLRLTCEIASWISMLPTLSTTHYNVRRFRGCAWWVGFLVVTRST